MVVDSYRVAIYYCKTTFLIAGALCNVTLFLGAVALKAPSDPNPQPQGTVATFPCHAAVHTPLRPRASPGPLEQNRPAGVELVQQDALARGKLEQSEQQRNLGFGLGCLGEPAGS